MNDLIITICRDTRKVKLNRGFIGFNGENLQGNIIVDFTDKAEFVDGTAYFEVVQKGEKYIIEMAQNAENKLYSLPIKSSLLQYACALSCQVRIEQENTENGIPVFKSEIFQVPCLEAVNATETIPEQYPFSIKEIVEALEKASELADEFGEAVGSIKANTQGIEKNANKIALLAGVQLQSGLQIIQPIEDAYSERVTANGESILDWQGNGSTARLLKVVGDTQATRNLFNIEKVTFENNTGYDNLVFEKVGNSLIFKSINGGNNYFSVRDGNDGLAPIAFYFKPNTTYTSFVTINVSTLSNTDYDLTGAGEMSCSLFLQTVASYDTTGTKVAIVDGYGLRRVEAQTVGTFTVLTTFTTPEDLSAHKFVSTRIGNNIQVTYTNLMIVEGEYTEETMPKYVQGFDGLKSASFQGIISSGLEESVLSFPAPVDCGLGVTIDFENQKIISQYKEVILNGTEDWALSVLSEGKNGNVFMFTLPSLAYSSSAVESVLSPSTFTRGDITGQGNVYAVETNIDCVLYIHWKDGTATLDEWKAYIAKNPLFFRYKTIEEIEIPFTDEQKAVGNEYKAWTDGTEQVTGNASALYAIYPTLTQEYVLVMDIKETAQETVDETITQALQEAY